MQNQWQLQYFAIQNYIFNVPITAIFILEKLKYFGSL